jgi:hypothetical protein
MAKTAFYTVRQPGLSRLSLQDGTHWRAFCYYDIRAYTLTPELLVLHHNDFLITLQGVNLRQLYLSLVVEEVYEIPLYTGAIPHGECVVTHIAIQENPKDD